MTNSKKILVTTTSSEIFIVRRGQHKAVRRFCGRCEREREMLDLDSAVTIFRIGTRQMMRQAETGAVHSIEIESGHLFVCTESLEALIRETKKILTGDLQ